MRSEIVINGEDKPKRNYPWMGIVYNDLDHIVVLFSKDSIGTIVYSTSNSDTVGYNCNYWNMEDFTEFEGSITLSNN